MLHKRMVTSDVSKAWDWLTALSPLLLMMVVNYPAAKWLALFASLGCLAVTALCYLVGLLPISPAPALVCGVLVTCCLPETAPAWVALVAGVFGGVAMGLVALVEMGFRKTEPTCPIYLPALTGYLAVRWLWAERLVGETIPALWLPDGVAGATPLATMAEGGVSADRLEKMFWGFDVGSMGSGPVLAVMLGCAFMMLRRRVNPLSTAAMLAVVAVAFQLRFAMPAFGLLAGGTMLAAVLLGDGGFVPLGWKGHLVSGAIAGGVTVFCRWRYGTDGAAVGVLFACVATTVLWAIYRLLRPKMAALTQKFAKTEN